MDAEGEEVGAYEADGVDQLETVWGAGFLSPGGAAEVGRIVAGASVDDAEVLDIGCGTGGPSLALALEHHARTVIGVDIEPFVINRATRLAVESDATDRCSFRAIEPGPLPFPDGTFDVVFSKDALVHVQDKAALYAEAHRVLRPGGRLCIGDWLRGEGEHLDPLVESFVHETGDEFFLQSLGELADLVAEIGFTEVEVTDRGDWYAEQTRAELDQLRGPLRDRFLDRFDQDFYDSTVWFWERALAATQASVLRPGHVRARKP